MALVTPQGENTDLFLHSSTSDRMSDHVNFLNTEEFNNLFGTCWFTTREEETQTKSFIGSLGVVTNKCKLKQQKNNRCIYNHQSAHVFLGRNV